jgi:hypothetical protein
LGRSGSFFPNASRSLRHLHPWILLPFNTPRPLFSFGARLSCALLSSVLLPVAISRCDWCACSCSAAVKQHGYLRCGYMLSWWCTE